MTAPTYTLRLTLEGVEIGRGRLTEQQYDDMWAALQRGDVHTDIVTPNVVYRLDAIKPSA